MDLQPGRRLDNVAHPAQVVDTRQLDQDLVGAQVVFLDGGFGHSQGIDSGADGVDRLLHRMLLNRLHLGLLHGEGPAVVWLGRYGVLSPVARIQQVAHITGLVRRRSLDLDELLAAWDRA